MKIRRDSHGLYIRNREEHAYRPGDFIGYSHAWNTTDAGLNDGDDPKTSYVSGTPFVRITLDDGSKVYWGSYDRTEGDFAEDKI